MSSTRTADRTETRVEDMAEPDHGQGQLPALHGGHGQAPPSQAQRQRDRIASFVAQVEARAADIKPFLIAQKVDWDFFIAGVRRAFMRDPKLVEAKPASFVQAVMDVARVGLIPDGKRAVIMAFKGVATPVIMYEGMLEVIYRAGVVTAIHAQVIYEGEDKPEFLSYDLGDEPFVKFTPPLDRDDSRKIVGAFARASTKEGGKWVELMGAKELTKVAKVNKAANGPGKNWPGEMARKAPLRRMSKFLPKTPDLVALFAIDEQSYLSAPEPEGAAARARQIPAQSLLGDSPYVAPSDEEEIADTDPDEVEDEAEGHGGDEAPAANEVDTSAMEAMIESAQDLDELEARVAGLHEDQAWGYGDLPAPAKARVELKIEERRAAFGRAARRLQITSRAGKSAPYAEPDVWAAAMLAKVSLPKTDELVAWWEKNLTNMEAAIDMARPQARRVLAAAATKGLPGVTVLVQQIGPDPEA